MIKENRVPLITLGLICLMPALFFWLLRATPLEMQTTPTEMIFGESSGLEVVVCGIFFPVMASLLGWLALRGNNRKRMSRFILLAGLIETAAGIGAAVFS